MDSFFAKHLKKLSEKDEKKIIYCAMTDRGGRENNEDASIALTLASNLYLFAIADGVGGQAAGNVASKLAITELKENIKKGLSVHSSISAESMKVLLALGYRKANEKICHQARVEPTRYGMGTTLVAALLNDHGRGLIANIGDSRAYIIGENIKRITKDHSYVQELVEKHAITQEEAAAHPEKNIVTKILGMDNVEPDFYEIELCNNILLLCSDGLIDALIDERIREVIISSTIESICKNLVEAAKPKSRDNITVIVAKRYHMGISDEIQRELRKKKGL